ncbi:MAG: type II secretion system F family protein [Thioploca sp.]|nr:type II secretion system F family protein [Thioploca sp.]
MFFNKNRIIATDITDLLSQLALLQESGISSHEALQVIQEGQEKRDLQRLIATIQTDLHQGQTLAESLAKYPQYIEPFLVAALQQGEQQDRQLAVLNNMVEYRESISVFNLTGELKRLLIYPATVLFITLLLAIIMLVYVIPVFADMFKSFGGELPILTTFFIDLSDWAVANWLSVVIILVGIRIYIWIANKRKSRLIAWVQLHLPLLGKLHRTIAIIRFLRACAFMLSAKMPLDKVISASVQAVDNSIYAAALTQISQQIIAGTPLTDALGKHPIFPKKVIQVTRVGIKTNQLDKLFIKLAEIYTKQTLKMIEPTIRVLNVFNIIILATIIGSVVIALYLPIFSMGSVI